MKILLMILLVIVILISGCAKTDKAYGVAKTAYGVGKAVAPLVPMDAKTRATLKAVDVGATLYDKGREVVREDQDKKKVAH